MASLAVGDTAGMAAAGAVLGGVVAAVALARWRAFRFMGAVVIGAYLAVLTAATLVAGLTPGGGDAARVAVFAGNPNVLGAALVTAMAAWAAVSPGRRWVWWAWPIVALAVLNTGSRTSGGALLGAGTAWLVLLALRLPRRRMLAPLVALLVVAAAAFAWQRGVVELTPNLLAAPSDLTHPAWRALGERVEVVADAVTGPFEGTRAQRLTGSATPTGRNVHRPEPRPLRDRGPVRRLRVPAGRRAAAAAAQLAPRQRHLRGGRDVAPVRHPRRLRQRRQPAPTAPAGGRARRELRRVRVRRPVRTRRGGDAVPRPAPRLDPQSMVNRYDLRRITFLPEDRVAIWRAGLDIARGSPWFGVGLGASPTPSASARVRRSAATA
jgi:hypothetical protein